MLPFLLFLPLAQVPPVPLTPLPPPEVIQVPETPQPPGVIDLPEDLEPREIVQLQEVRVLPGQLDKVPVFNSNSPEVVQTEGILLSTFPPAGKQSPQAHLDFSFQGRFDIFAHHIARAAIPEETRTLFQGIIIYNPGTEPVRIDILQAASYLTRPDALFIDLPPFVEDPLGRVYAGPGDRVVNDILRGRRQGNWPPVIEIPPGQSQMLMNLPIPVGSITPSSNGRSTLMRLWSSGPVYVASLALFAPQNLDGTERIPTLEEWETLLVLGQLSGPRDLVPTPPRSGGRLIYGRVAGVALGSQWQVQITDKPSVDYLKIPPVGEAFSYGLSTLPRGTLGTNQVQSAPLVARYADTAYQSHGNYGVQYSLTLPLYNSTTETQTVTLAIQTPLKEDRLRGGLRFYEPPAPQIFFRGPVRIRYKDDQGVAQTRFIHLVQRRGQQGEPLVTLQMPAGDRRLVQVDLLYPPDSTPPQVLTVRTLKP